MAHIPAGSTSVKAARIYCRATTGAALTGKVAADFTSANGAAGKLSYRRDGDVVDVTLADLSDVTDAYTEGGIIHVDGAEYAVHLPDAAYATGAPQVSILGAVEGGEILVYPISLGVNVVKVNGLDAELGAGTGARTVTITVDDGADPLESAKVRVTKGALTYVQETDVSGEVGFNLDDGAWAVAITLAGYSYAGTTLTVDGDETETYSMSAVSFTPSTMPDSVTVRWTVIDSADFQEVGASEATIYIRIKTPPITDGFAWDKGERSATSDANGMVEFTDVPIGSVLRVRLGATGEWNDIEIPSDATSPYDAGEFIGIV